MKQNIKSMVMFFAALGVLLVLATSPVLARQGSDDGNSGSGSSSSSSEDENENSDVDEDEDFELEVEHKVNFFKQHGKDMLKVKRERTANLKSVERRQKTCENIQKAVNNKLAAFNQRADRYLGRLDDVFSKIQAYQAANNLPVSNYDELLQTATQKQSDAAVAVEALKSFGTTLDCSVSDPATMLSAVKEAGSEARDALKDYRKSLKEMVVSLVQAQGDTTETEDTEEN